MMNVDMLFADLLSFVVILVVSKLVFRSIRHPVFIICAWWCACLMLSNAVRIGEGIQPGTHLVFLLFNCSIFGFGILFHLLIQSVRHPIPMWVIRYKSTWIAISAFVYLVVLGLGFLGYQLQKAYGVKFRELSFSTGEYSSLLYGNYYLQVAAELVLTPLVLFGIMALAVAGVFYNKYRYLLLGFVFSAAVAFQGSGRFPIYYFILATVLAVVFVKKIRWRACVKLLSVCLAAIFIIAVISKQRVLLEEFNREIVVSTIEQAVTYHVLGIHLFNHEFSDRNSMLRQGTSFGRLSLFSFPDKIICMVLRRFGIFASPTIDAFGTHWQEAVPLGYDKNGQVYEANAFYTSLYPVFYDFGYWGIVILPGIFVYFLVLHQKTYSEQNNFISLFAVVFLSIFFMTSLFNSKITSMDFVVITYCIIMMRIWRWRPAQQPGMHPGVR